MSRTHLYLDEIEWETSNPVPFYFPIPEELSKEIVTPVTKGVKIRVFSVAPLNFNPLLFVCGENLVKDTLYNIIDDDEDIYGIRFGWCDPAYLDLLPEHTGW